MSYTSEQEPFPAPDPTRKPDSPPLPDELAQTLAGLGPAGDAPAARKAQVPWTRTSAVWAGVWAGVAVLVLLIIFVAQNTGGARISFLWMEGQIPLALALLIAGVAGAVIAMAVAAARIIQLRRLVRKGR
ncbi:lipopolysaccharide assembly protein LapA domain-containing protein [Symbioplanes lichenis]|uniref:lipopolysaccharide assembly protein LapA domain-containing protein n=1 Tax=Symbioplanes lichenis TaxID=1629072 RepID=UPI0027388BA1|nr:lipopolysaccharide assembly protein LapA domain-containing protein [Actinoplanes lichenis]